MKKPFTILLLSILLLTPLSLAHHTTPTTPPAPSDTNTPIWTTGDFWTYRVNNLSLNFNEENQTIIIHATIADLTLKVISETNNTYLVAIQPTTITGDYAINVNFGDGPINVTGEFKDTTLSGNIVMSKTDLGFKTFNININGTIIIRVHQQPYFPTFPQKLTFATKIKTSADFAAPYAIIAFPLNVSNIWGIPANAVTLSGTIDSPWFKTINFFNQIVRRFQLYGLVAHLMQTDKQSVIQLSDLLNDLFPTVDIAHVMNEYVGTNVINTTEIPPVLICNNTENVTVGAGTFLAYNITTPIGGSNIYFAPDAGYIIKMVGRFNDTLPYVSGVNIELMDTNYQR